MRAVKYQYKLDSAGMHPQRLSIQHSVAPGCTAYIPPSSPHTHPLPSPPILSHSTPP